MENLTEKQKNRLLRLAKIHDLGELGIAELIEELFDKLEETVKIAKGDKGDKGDPGESVAGPKGKDGKDGQDGKSIVGPIGPKGDKGEDSQIPGPQGAKGDKGDEGSPDTPSQIVEKLELLEGEERLDAKAIKGLDEMERRIKSTIPRGGGAARRVFIPYRDNFSAQTDGATKIFYLTRAPLDEATIMVFGTDFPQILRPTIDFTIANKTLTLTSAVPAPTQGATLLCSYFS